MTSQIRVPEEGELFSLAIQTREAVKSVLGDEHETVLGLLGVAAFQLQAAHVGNRIAFLADDPAATDALRMIATDYGGASSAALNLSVRCSVTAVDLCGAAIGRLIGHSLGSRRECDAAEIGEYFSHRRPSGRFSEGIAGYLTSIKSQLWTDTVDLRDRLTHRPYSRGIYGGTRSPDEPPPLAWPRHIDVEWGHAGMTPLNDVAQQVVSFAESTFVDFCWSLILSE